MEIFDIVDGLGNPTGETVERTKAHAEGICHRTAHIWIVRVKDGVKQVLLQKRAMNKDSFPGLYDTSSAGHIQAGDEPFESACRELEEELGIKAEKEDLEFAGTFRIKYEREFYGKMFRDNEVAFIYVYSKPVDESKLVLQEEEVESVAWFDLEEVYRQCSKGKDSKGRGIFCVPMGGLMVVRSFMRDKCKYKFYGREECDAPELMALTKSPAVVYKDMKGAACGEDLEGEKVPLLPLKGINNPLDLYDALSTIWCEYTCAPRLRGGWSKENMTLGQCSITGFLVQDIFGGDVYGILRPGGNYHCYNVIEGHKFDLTSEQFGDEVLDYEENPQQFREVHFAKEEKRCRYEWLKAKLWELYS